MANPRRRAGTALPWILITVVAIVMLALFSGTLQIPGIRIPTVNLTPYQPYIVALVVLLATKIFLEVMKPVFRIAVGRLYKTEAEVFQVYQLLSYAIWIGAFVFVLLFLISGAGAEFSFLGTALVSAAVIYVLQEPLLNVVGWILLVTRQIYRLGDRIEMADTKGYVVAISTMNTSLREFGGWMTGDRFTGRYVIVPNSFILKGKVFNYTRDNPFVWEEVQVSVTFESDHRTAERYVLEATEEVVGEFMRENLEVVRRSYEFRDLLNYMVEKPTVRWALSDSWVTMTVVFFCPAHRKQYYKSEITKRVLDRIREDPNVSIAYPHIEIVPYGGKSRKAPGEPDIL